MGLDGRALRSNLRSLKGCVVFGVVGMREKKRKKADFGVKRSPAR